MDRHGTIHTVAGKMGNNSYGGDGGPGTASLARLSAPARLSVNAAGDVYAAASSELRVRAITTQVVAATFWTSDATIAHTGAIYAWGFVSKTTAAVSSITITVPSAVNSNTTGLYVVSAVHLTGTGTPTLSGSTLTYTLAAPVAVPAGRRLYLSVAGFTNTSTTGWYAGTITTRIAGAAAVGVSHSGTVAFIDPAPVLVLPNASATLTAPPPCSSMSIRPFGPTSSRPHR